MLNFPGSFCYTSETDNCDTRQQESPRNILYDEEGREHVFIQPRNVNELLGETTAAVIDPFSSYGFDGNDHWNLDLIWKWWTHKD